jgi:acyl transferase domain-containing protein
VILEQAPEDAPVPDGSGLPYVPLVVSGRSAEAVRAQAARLLAHLDGRPGERLLDVGFSLATMRTAFERRGVVVADERDAALRGLRQLASGSMPVPSAVGGLGAFVFSGQGSQRPGMGRELAAAFPVFAEALDTVCARFEGLREVMFGDDAGLLARTGWAQPAIFAFEVALYRLLESWGLRPDAVAGHSIGEIAAAHVAGVFSLDDACRVVAARSRLMEALPEGGAMVAVEAGEEELELPEGVAVAAVNGPRAVVLSGEACAVRAFAGGLVQRRARELRVSHAFHSPLMEPMLEAFGAEIADVAFGVPTVPLVSTVTGTEAGEELRSAAYWVRQVREPVRFADAVEALRARGVRQFVEVGPDAVLTPYIDGCLPTARRTRGEAESVVGAAGRLAVDWQEFYAGTGARRVDLPTYAFQRRRYWLDSWTGSGGARQAGQDRAGQALQEAAEATTALRKEIAEAPAAEREVLLLRLVRTYVAAALGHDTVDGIDPDLPFQELGFDSVTAVEFRDALAAAVGVSVPATLVFDHPTSRAAAAYLDAALAPATDDPAIAVLAEVDRLETALTALAAADGLDADRRKVTARLEALLRRWADARNAQVDADAAAFDAPAFDTATDDELFEALDSQLGI